MIKIYLSRVRLTATRLTGHFQGNRCAGSFVRPSSCRSSSALVLGAVVVWVRFRRETTGPIPLPVATGDREIVWLYQATSGATWERFVTAVQRVEEQLKNDLPGLKAKIDDRTFPRQSTAVPEVSLSWNGAGGRLLFRWYKLTSEWTVQEWVRALLKDRPAPLAIIGGNSSDNARDLAIQLRAATANLPAEQWPLLLLTTATADIVDWPAELTQPEDLPLQPPETASGPPRVGLTDIYPRRTFRFCFSNRQMSEAVTHFVWSRQELRPEDNCGYMIRWQDDPYSRDLYAGFVHSLLNIAQDEVPHILSSCVALLGSGDGYAPLLTSSVMIPGTAPRGITFDNEVIYSSFGPIQPANRLEFAAVNALLNTAEPGLFAPRELPPNARRLRHLLIVTGQSIPLRRFLRELARLAPGAARRFVVATGDGLAFNTVYRDRLVTWPIEDLPFPLVFFTHANPIDADAGFRPHARGETGSNKVGDSGATGTEDVLLFADMVGAVTRGAAVHGGPLADAPRLATQLASARYEDGRIVVGTGEGRLLFDADGNRAGGTGEHVVYLKPLWEGARALDQADIEVLSWRATGSDRTWELCGKLQGVSYDQGKTNSGGVAHEQP